MPLRGSKFHKTHNFPLPLSGDCPYYIWSRPFKECRQYRSKFIYACK